MHATVLECKVLVFAIVSFAVAIGSLRFAIGSLAFAIGTVVVFANLETAPVHGLHERGDLARRGHVKIQTFLRKLKNK